MRKGTPLNLTHFRERARQSGHLKAAALEPSEFLSALRARIATLDVAAAREDIGRFVSDVAPLEIWSRGYFLALS